MGLAVGHLFSPISPMRVFFRFVVLGDCWGQKHGFRLRCTDGGAERSSKREIPLLASQALATDPPRFFRVKRARKHRLVGPKCASAATQISPTRLKLPKMAAFVATSPQRVFSRISLCQAAVVDVKPPLRPKGGCGMPLRTRLASRPKGTSFGALKRRAHMGTKAHVLAR